MKRVLITGANSYIGTSFERFMSQWPDVYRTDTVDMVGEAWRDKSFASYDAVFHVAGIAHIDTRKLDQQARNSYWKVNAQLPIEVARKAKMERVGQFIFLSSMSVYGQNGSMHHPVVITKETEPTPKDIYGESKMAAEHNIHSLQDGNFRVCILRPPMVYGQGCKGNYAKLINVALKSPFFPDISNERSMLSIDNLCIYLKMCVDERLAGIHFPQDDEYVCTSRMVREIVAAHGGIIRMTRAFNPVLRFLSGKITIVDKVFGSLIYQRNG